MNTLSRIVFFVQIFFGRLVAAPWLNQGWVRCANGWLNCMRSRLVCIKNSVRSRDTASIVYHTRKMLYVIFKWLDSLLLVTFGSIAKLSLVRHINMAWTESRIPRHSWSRYKAERQHMWRAWMR